MMKGMRLLVAALVVIVVGFSSASAQSTYDLQFVSVLNNGANYAVKVQIRSNVSTFGMGTSNLTFTYDNTALSTPTLDTAYIFTGGLYFGMTVTEPVAGRVSVNIVYNGGASSGTVVPAIFADVVRIKFTTLNVAGNSSLAWRTASPNSTVVFADDNATLVTQGTLFNLNTSPLPIQLSSFMATLSTSSQASLQWTTISETNNYGFYVQKAADLKPASFQTIPESFVKGSGTTTSAHTYSYIDNNYVAGKTFYRLKQTDLDGTIHYSEPVGPSGTTGITDRPLPTEYALNQNYPNPFNPSTFIEFALPKESRVKVEIFNILGQQVKVLIDEVRPAGYHTVRFDAGSLSSGMYLYRLSTADKSFVKKLLLTK